MKKKLTQKQVRRKYRKQGLKMAHKDRKKKAVIKEDEFLNEDSNLIVEDAYVSHPSEDDVQDVLRGLDGFRDFASEMRGNGLTYGDY